MGQHFLASLWKLLCLCSVGSHGKSRRKARGRAEAPSLLSQLDMAIQHLWLLCESPTAGTGKTSSQWSCRLLRCPESCGVHSIASPFAQHHPQLLGRRHKPERKKSVGHRDLKNTS